jgi:hypothetical protein
MASDEKTRPIMGPVTVLRLRRDGVAWTEVDGEVVALDERASVYVGANAAGGLLWNELVAGTTREALAERLAATYELNLEQAQQDTDAFLTALREQELLEG